MAWMIKRLLVLFLMTENYVYAQTEQPDSISRPASKIYSDPTFLTRVLMGSNYRDVWGTPVKSPVFYMSQHNFKILKLGGGQQTLSLRLEDKEGKEWVLRTLDKDLSKLRLPKFLPKEFIIPIAQEQISAAFPYSHTIVYSLAKAAGIVAAKPTLYWVADDPGLGDFRQQFANKYAVLEQREPTPDDSDTKSTTTVLENVLGENHFKIVQQKVLKARLLDMLVADWDRHADQWRWDKVDSGKLNLYYAIPRDRDQAFFLSNGLVVKIMQLFGFKQLSGFKPEPELKRINWKSWNFDRSFLNELDQHDWEKSIAEFQSALPDSVIEAAVRTMPPEIFAMEGENFIHKLKSRRDGLNEEVIEYYEHISRVVVVNGTEEAEEFTLTSREDSLILSIKDKKTSRPSYTRSFDPGITWKLIIDARAGNDVFYMDESVSSPVRVEIKGGAGADNFYLKGKVRTKVFDDRSPSNTFDLGRKVKKKLSR